MLYSLRCVFFFAVFCSFICPGTISAFVLSPTARLLAQAPNTQVFSKDDALEGENEEEAAADEVVELDVGGSGYTDRFKYKVSALMGAFDPHGEDDERQEGNILNAMLEFPVTYSFNVVGKTMGEEELSREFVKQVKDVVSNITGDNDDLKCEIIPRGENFTKVTIQATVESAAMITATYNDLEALELAVMRF